MGLTCIRDGGDDGEGAYEFLPGEVSIGTSRGLVSYYFPADKRLSTDTLSGLQAEIDELRASLQRIEATMPRRVTFGAPQRRSAGRDGFSPANAVSACGDNEVVVGIAGGKKPGQTFAMCSSIELAPQEQNVSVRTSQSPASRDLAAEELPDAEHLREELESLRQLLQRIRRDIPQGLILENAGRQPGPSDFAPADTVANCGPEQVATAAGGGMGISGLAPTYGLTFVHCDRIALARGESE